VASVSASICVAPASGDRERCRVPKDDRLRSAVGADYFTGSLRETVDAYLQVAQNSVLPS